MVHGISGEVDARLAPLERIRSSEVLTLILPEVEGEAEHEIRRLIELTSGKRDVRVWFYATRTTAQPFMIGPGGDPRPWSKHGDLYTCSHVGTVRAGSLEMVPAGQEDAVWIWLCLAAA